MTQSHGHHRGTAATDAVALLHPTEARAPNTKQHSIPTEVNFLWLRNSRLASVRHKVAA